MWGRYERLASIDRMTAMIDAVSCALAFVAQKIAPATQLDVHRAEFENIIREAMKTEERTMALDQASMSIIDKDYVMIRAIAHAMAWLVQLSRSGEPNVPRWW